LNQETIATNSNTKLNTAASKATHISKEDKQKTMDATATAQKTAVTNVLGATAAAAISNKLDQQVAQAKKRRAC
jgi:hypothetical protein